MKRLFLAILVTLSALSGLAQGSSQPSLSVADSAAIDSAINAALAKSVDLEEVTVTAQRPLVKNEIDRMSYDIQADGDSRTLSTLEMLKKVPLVSVDGKDEIRVKGGTNFKIYKNGHPDPSLSTNAKEVLKAIPASMVKRIEVITEPGAKYDAEGVSAILNIVMAETTSVNGLSGTVGAGVNQYGDPNASAYLTTQLGKVVASVNYGYRHVGDHMKQLLSNDVNYTASGTSLHSEGESATKVNINYGNLDLSWEPDTLNLLSASFGGFFYNFRPDSETQVGMRDSDGRLLYSYRQLTASDLSSFYSFNGRADYEHKTHRKNEAITLSYMLSTSRNKLGQNHRYVDPVNPPMPYDSFSQHNKENFWEHTFQLDWARPFARWHKMETGVKYIYRSNHSHTQLAYGGGAVSDVDTEFDHLTQVAAAYLSYTYQRDKWSARAGLRYEWSYLRAEYPDGSAEGFHRSLNDWVPTASLSYQFDMANSLKFAFSTRIERPGISYLNPAVIDAPESVSFGNPGLSSARHYSMSATFMHIGPKFTFNVVPVFSLSNNQITQVQTASGGKTVSTYANTLSERWAGLSGFFQWQLHEKTSVMFNGNIGYSRYRSKDLDLKNSGWDSFFYTQVTQQLPWKLRLTGNVGQWDVGADGLYGKQGHAWFYGFGLQRSFLKEDRLTVRLNAQSPFNKRTEFVSRTIQGDYTGRRSISFPQRDFSVSVSYRFGSLNARVKKASATIDNNDVVGGSSAGGNGAQGGTPQSQAGSK